MMNLADLTAWVLAASALVTDPAGHRFTRGISRDGASAIASGCLAKPLFKEDDGTHCAALLLVMAARESGYQDAVVGDCWSETLKRYVPANPDGTCPEGSTPRALGPFQSHTLKGPVNWSKAVDNYMPIVHQSMTSCPDHPLAALAGSCASSRARDISASRIQEAKRVWYAMQPPTAEK